MSLHSRKPSRRLAKIATIAVIPLALLGAGALVSTASYSAFSATTSDQSNWSMGSVALSNGTPSGAAFNVNNLKPGSTDSTCVAVTSTGSLPAEIQLYATSASQTQGIGDWVTLQITQGTGAGNGTCDGFTPLATGSSIYNDTLTSFVSNVTGYSSGIGNWVTNGQAPETRTFQITYTVLGNAPSTVMGATAGLSFTWEAQNQ